MANQSKLQKVSNKELVQRIAILERDRDRIATLLSITRQIVQNVTALGTGLSSIACLTTSTTRTSKQGTSLSIYSNTAESFPIAKLETLMDNIIHDTKS